MRFEFKQTGSTSWQIFYRGELIAEIRELCLANVRFQPGGSLVIGETVPLSLYWWQYANHEDPEQNTGSNGKLTLVEQTDSRLSWQCTGTNRSQTALSAYRVVLNFDSNLQRFVFQIRAELNIPAGKKWRILPNPAHGELEFCNLWPEASFGTTANFQKKYQACFAKHDGEITRIPHHHLDSSDKQNILLGAGGSFYWLLEDENPVVEILTPKPVHAGVCAYQWDAHFGYRVGDGRNELWLTGAKKFVAEFRLSAIDRAQGARIAARATEVISPEDLEIPVFVPGVNSFGATIQDFPDPAGIWPWQFSGGETAQGRVCRTRGFGDQNSLEIKNSAGSAQWLFTALGPAFGQAVFVDTSISDKPSPLPLILREGRRVKKNVIQRYWFRFFYKISDKIQKLFFELRSWLTHPLTPSLNNREGEPRRSSVENVNKCQFPDGVRLRLSGYLSSEKLDGEAFLAIRFHQPDHGSVFRLEDYEIRTSPVKISGTSGWTFCEVVTPPISPAPDRVHLILQQNGHGRSWFDDIKLEGF